jgi:hypothetical protein
MLGTAESATRAGFNVVRLNQRNCGGTAHLTPKLYNSSLSGDVRAVVEELIERDGLPEIFTGGFSMGGNLVLKMAGEFGHNPPRELRAVVGISPAIDLAAAVDAMEKPRNRLYQMYFVNKLKRRFRAKVRLYPELYRAGGLADISTIREFDDAVTAPYCGFANAADYYRRASARGLLQSVSLPAMLLVAQDDPMIPFASFADPAIVTNHQITLDAPGRGGHCAFISANPPDRFWADARIVEFCRQHSQMAGVETAGIAENVLQPSHSGMRAKSVWRIASKSWGGGVCSARLRQIHGLRVGGETAISPLSRLGRRIPTSKRNYL